MQINHYYVERQCLYACLSCDGFKICELITNDLIQWVMLNLVNLPHVPLYLIVKQWYTAFEFT